VPNSEVTAHWSNVRFGTIIEAFDTAGSVFGTYDRNHCSLNGFSLWRRVNGTAESLDRKGELWCDDDLAKAVRHMEALKIRRLPVINKGKRMIGILSLSGRRQPFGVREGYAAGEASRRPNFVMRFHVNPSFWLRRSVRRQRSVTCPPGAPWLWANILRKLGAIRPSRMVPSE
jgi:hypothetical protein